MNTHKSRRIRFSRRYEWCDATIRTLRGLTILVVGACAGKVTADPTLTFCKTGAPQIALDAINNAIAQADRTCQSDDDCMAHFLDLGCCMSSCGSNTIYVSNAGALQAQSTADQVNQAYCSPNVWTCMCPMAPCISSKYSNYPACVNGQCTSVPDLAWQWLTIVRNVIGSGAIYDPPGTVPNCGTSTGCTQWQVNTSGQVYVTGGARDAGSSAAPAGTLSTSELVVLDSILHGPAFRKIGVAAPPCDAASTDEQILFAIQGNRVVAFDGTGCVTAGPVGNDVQQVFDIVSDY